MLVLLNFDSASLPLLERMMDDGRLPTVADLFRRGRRYALETPAGTFPSACYPVLYSGLDLSEHGLYYTFLWSPAEQRIRYIDRFPSPPSAWEAVSAAGAVGGETTLAALGVPGATLYSTMCASR